MVLLAEAWNSGAHTWMPERREAYVTLHPLGDLNGGPAGDIRPPRTRDPHFPPSVRDAQVETGIPRRGLHR